jgi:hypothetical protein
MWLYQHKIFKLLSPANYLSNKNISKVIIDGDGDNQKSSDFHNTKYSRNTVVKFFNVLHEVHHL